MTVNLTRIYTKLGDRGETHLGDMSRVSKLHPRVEAYGTVDELNATLGVALLAPGMPARFRQWLERAQNDLLDVGADLCVPPPASEASDAIGEPPPAEQASQPAGARPSAEQAYGSAGEPRSAEQASQPAGEGRSRLRVSADYTEWLERVCDEVNAKLAPLRTFVIPGGNAASAQLHVCRTVCRRAERRALAIGEDCNPEVIRYLNRLSDMLFILSRAANEDSEALWEPGAHEARSSA